MISGDSAGKRPEIVAEIEELLARFGLEAEIDQPTRTLPLWQAAPAGDRPRAGCAPRVLLLDEPAAGVPEEERHDILAALAALPATSRSC